MLQNLSTILDNTWIGKQREFRQYFLIHDLMYICWFCTGGICATKMDQRVLILNLCKCVKIFSAVNYASKYVHYSSMELLLVYIVCPRLTLQNFSEIWNTFLTKMVPCPALTTHLSFFKWTILGIDFLYFRLFNN